MAGLEDLTPEARDELAGLARDLSENPATRKDFLRLTKKAKPQMAIPEIDIDDQVRTALAESTKRTETLENRLRERDATDELGRRRKKVADRFGDEAVPEVEKIMLERGIQNHETAADYFEWMKQAEAPTPSSYRPSVLDKDTRTTLAPYWKNPQMAARDEAQKALNDLRKRRA